MKKFHFQCSQSFWRGPKLDKIQNIKYVILKFLLKVFQHHVKFFNCVFQIQLWVGKTLVPNLNSDFKILICGYSCGETRDYIFFTFKDFHFIWVCVTFSMTHTMFETCVWPHSPSISLAHLIPSISLLNLYLFHLKHRPC
jgi:hypothetical protein